VNWGAVFTEWGRFHAAWDECGICALRFPGQSAPRANREGPLFRQLAQELNAYFAGELREFTLPLSLSGTPFQLAVWEELLRVPYGEVVSYGGLARRIGRARAARAVGGAVGANPVPILVPCHRVVRGDGSLGGFGPGLEWKRRLLALEGAKWKGSGRL